MLCVDASTRFLGLALYVNGELKEVFGWSNLMPFSLDKLETMFKYFNQILLKHGVDHIVIEKPAPVRFSKTLTSLNQCVGVLIGCAFSNGVTVDFVHNRTAKKIMKITEKGKAGKQQAINITKLLYPKFADQIITDHIADAIIVGEAYKVLMADPLNRPSTEGFKTTYAKVKR